MNKKIKASILLGIATLMWGLSYTIQSISANNLGTYTVVFFKGIGGLFLIPIVIILKKKFNKYTFIGGILMGISTFAGCAFQQAGIVLSGVSKAGFITVLYIVIVPVIELFMGKTIKKKLLFAVLLALAGLYFLCISGTVSLNIGDLYLLLGSLCFALQIILIDHYSKKSDGISLCLVLQIVLAILAAIMMIYFEKPAFVQIQQALMPILYMVFLSGALAGCLQTVYQKYLEPSLASLIMSFESVFSAIFGWLLLSQSLSGREIMGCLMVMIAIFIAE